MFDSLAKAGKYLGQAAKLMIGMPDMLSEIYDTLQARFDLLQHL